MEIFVGFAKNLEPVRYGNIFDKRLSSNRAEDLEVYFGLSANSEDGVLARKISNGIGRIMQATVVKLDRLLAIAQEEGIQVRREWLRGVRGGLVRILRTPILFVDDSLSLPEQYEQVKKALEQLDWSETPHAEEMLALLEVYAV